MFNQSVRNSFKLKVVILCLICLGMFLGTAVKIGSTVYGDGIFYYSWLRSVVIDHDMDFRNEYAFFQAGQLPTKTGLIGNQFAIGPAMLWSPSYLMTHRLLAGDGLSFLYQLSTGFSSVLYMLAGLVILYRLLAKHLPTNIATWTILGVLFATNLLFYGAIDTVNSHALSFFIGSVLVSLLLQPHAHWGVIGFFAGVMGAIRIQDSAFLLIPGIILLSKTPVILKEHSIKEKLVNLFQLLRQGLWLGIGWAIPVSFQFFIWYLLYGDLRIPYLERGYGFQFLNPQMLSVLFSPNNGLFLWTPIYSLALFGLFLSQKWLAKPIRFSFIFFFLWQTYLIGSWSIWWQGASYSGRMFIGLLPLLSLGLAGFMNYDRISWRIRLSLIIACVILNLTLIAWFMTQN